MLVSFMARSKQVFSCSRLYHLFLRDGGGSGVPPPVWRWQEVSYGGVSEQLLRLRMGC